MNMKTHGALTVKVAETLSNYYAAKGYDVLYDHGPKKANVGKIVSWFGEKYCREAELSQLDIAIVEKSFHKAIALIEIEETSDSPKTILGDVFGVLLGDHICFSGKQELLVDEHTTLIVLGKSEITHVPHSEYLQDKVMEIKSLLSTGNSRIGTIIIDTFYNEEELSAGLLSVLDKAFKGE